MTDPRLVARYRHDADYTTYPTDTTEEHNV
jgi:hypothetical protein